mmetsp:Transcript_108849/g.318493  ORF Transcript_108849/g.318493 Transcript_108849/m.318493 type:complete len:206 (+) Transcript_108849:651-1268(+)
MPARQRPWQPSTGHSKGSRPASAAESACPPAHCRWNGARHVSHLWNDSASPVASSSASSRQIGHVDKRMAKASMSSVFSVAPITASSAPWHFSRPRNSATGKPASACRACARGALPASAHGDAGVGGGCLDAASSATELAAPSGNDSCRRFTKSRFSRQPEASRPSLAKSFFKSRMLIVSNLLLSIPMPAIPLSGLWNRMDKQLL